ncbi:MAG TPA: peptidoglycan DD-metalloendopeptidase family protein [Pyrinomonadaceae bacterium]|nr:peptidoglycan DD-metalloendopeptidase family protein [Pyrinomonadaceae bacterium]
MFEEQTTDAVDTPAAGADTQPATAAPAFFQTRSARTQVGVWRELSDYVLRARCGGEAAESNEALQHFINESPDDPLAPALMLWVGDNFKLDTRFTEAVAAYGELARRYPLTAARDTTPLQGFALKQTALCHESLGDWHAAVETYRALADGFPSYGTPARWHYRAGAVSEQAGRTEAAAEFYRRAAEEAGDPAAAPDEYRDLARRAAARLENPGRRLPSARALAEELARALRAGDVEALRRLASPTHFAAGLTHLHFIPFDALAEAFRADLAESRVSADPFALEGAGDKLTLVTRGWRGETFSGRVSLLLNEGVGGWQWTGVGISERRKKFDDQEPDIEPDPSQFPPISLPGFSLKAPWPKGDCFRAGGRDRFILSSMPFIGKFIRIVDTFSCCGFGPYGLYFGHGPTHQGTDHFAVDFVRYQPGAPFVNRAQGTPVLAAHEGVVTGDIEDGHSFAGGGTGNHVILDWLNPADLQDYRTNRPHTEPNGTYRTRYLHLDRGLLVSPRMLIRQGARMGTMDHTGNSAMPHLHFALHRRDGAGGYSSIPPHPFDGQDLQSEDDGDCVSSTNVPFP